MSYPWVHFNENTVEEIQEILPGNTIISDGDCGSVWGEHHYGCPYPHVLAENVDKLDISFLKEASVAFYADPTKVWGEHREQAIDNNWLEDGQCPYRQDRVEDYRHPFGEDDVPL